MARLGYVCQKHGSWKVLWTSGRYGGGKNADTVKTSKIQYVINGEVGSTTIEDSRIRRLILLKVFIEITLAEVFHRIHLSTAQVIYLRT